MKTLLFAGTVALLVSLIGTRYLIHLLIRLRIGQPIREDGPQGHSTKAGTPTMGGAAIVGGAVLGYVVSDLSQSRIITSSGLVVMFAIIGAGAVGLMDDWIKVVKERNLGLSKRAKMLGLLAVAIGFAVLAIETTPVHTELSITRFDSLSFDLGRVGHNFRQFRGGHGGVSEAGGELSEQSAGRIAGDLSATRRVHRVRGSALRAGGGHREDA